MRSSDSKTTGADQHAWIPSALGHGETMCERCHTTNREAAAIGLWACEMLGPACEDKPANAVNPDDLDWAMRTWAAVSGEGAPAGSMERFLILLAAKGAIGTYRYERQ